MGRKNVPFKTNEGTQEIKARALGLAPRIRTALLLVDGVKSVAELERLMTAAGVTTGALQLLLDKGLIRFPDEEPEQAVVEVLREASHSIPNPTILIPEPAFAEAAVAADEIAATIVAVQAPPAPLPATPPQLAEVDKEIPVEVSRPKKPPEAPAAVAPETQIVPMPTPAKPPRLPSLEVVTLLQLETILGVATKMEMETILGVATKLELTPTQVLAPKTAVKAQTTEQHLPPLLQAEHDYWAAQIVAPTPVIPAAILRMNLTVARAHLASALDLFLEVDGYALKQRVVACESRAELEKMFPLVVGALIRKIDKSATARLMGVAQALLER